MALQNWLCYSESENKWGDLIDCIWNVLIVHRSAFENIGDCWEIVSRLTDHGNKIKPKYYTPLK